LYLDDGQLGFAMLDGQWIDAGTFDSLAEASEMAQQAADTVPLAVAA
jgi:dTDP-glucose pyrophosphorylase